MDSIRSTARRRALFAALASATLLTAAAQGTGVAAAQPADERPTAAAGSHPTADDGYYDDAQGKTGQALKDSLHKIISSNTKTLTYSQVTDALKDTDQDPAHKDDVIELYSGHSVPKDDNGGGKGDWNKEHVWAKSHGDFGTSPGPGTDVHHLRPADVGVNSIRGNKDFDNGGSEVEGAPGNRSDDDSFEPRDAVKGDVARMILYMAVRYEGDDSFPDLEPNDKVDNGSAPHIGRLSVLKKWSDEDPPDDFEKNRNQVIYDKYQHNRNPFVDHPEWVGKIW